MDGQEPQYFTQMRFVEIWFQRDFQNLQIMLNASCKKCQLEESERKVGSGLKEINFIIRAPEETSDT